LLGLLQQPEQWRRQRMRSVEVDPAEIDRLIRARSTARAERDFAAADAIRSQLDALGIELEDGANGTSWRLRSGIGA
ncbi:MAG: cysteine--tRNA ligase, partial [Gammaproteobacteria bacterium]|nr:cysteine--tRNA ligase [Gammaproteobacteria bacterium]